MAATRSTGSEHARANGGMSRSCHRLWNSASWSWQSCPKAWRAAYRTRMCWSCMSCTSMLAIVSKQAASSTYSTEARIAMAAPYLPCQLPAEPYFCNKAMRSFLVSLKPIFLTKKSTLASPVLKRLSSSSSSSSSSTCCQSSSSSTSARKAKASSKALGARLGMALTSALHLDSVTVEIHSKAMARVPSGMVPLAPAKVNMMSTHSRHRGLKKVTLSSALWIRDWRASSSAEGSLPDRAFRAPSIMGNTGCIAWQLWSSRTPIISQTRLRPATCSCGVESPLLTRVPSPWRCSRMAGVAGVPTSSDSNLRPLSWCTTVVPLANLKAFGISSGQGPDSSPWAATEATPAIKTFRTWVLVSTSMAWNRANLILACTSAPAFPHAVFSGPTLTIARRSSVAACVRTTSSLPVAGRRHSASEANTRPGSRSRASV
mmetsp:Transcript_56782/g.146145  ORF Transcript_56782/g.146145 Transcript_56782/m.146145 type:complete len:431 (+) Transcript_56782:1773-3065(+)